MPSRYRRDNELKYRVTVRKDFCFSDHATPPGPIKRLLIRLITGWRIEVLCLLLVLSTTGCSKSPPMESEDAESWKKQIEFDKKQMKLNYMIFDRLRSNDRATNRTRSKGMVL